MISFRRIGRDSLDVEFPVGRGITARIIERPGLWMSDREREQLVQSLREVAERVLPRGLRYGVLSGEKRFLDKAIITLVSAGQPVAFGTTSLLDVELDGRMQEVLHIGLVMTDARFRERGLTRILGGLPCFLHFVRTRFRACWVSNVTQVPSAFGKAYQALDRVYPSLDPEVRPSRAHRHVAGEILRRHRRAFGVGDEAYFDEEKFIIRNAYTGGSDGLKKSFEDAPKHRDPAVNELCRRELDYDRGDDFLQLGRLNPIAIRKYLSSFLPRYSVTAAIRRIAHLAVASGQRWLENS